MSLFLLFAIGSTVICGILGYERITTLHGQEFEPTYDRDPIAGPQQALAQSLWYPSPIPDQALAITSQLGLPPDQVAH